MVWRRCARSMNWPAGQVATPHGWRTRGDSRRPGCGALHTCS